MTRLFPLFLLAGGLLLAGVAAAGAAQSEDPDWPCIQRKVPEISAGMIWAGPPVEEMAADWQADPAMALLVARLSARRTPIEQAEALIADYAAGLGAARGANLTRLFAGTLATINRERSEIISGIQRYARRQAQLADKIARQFAELDGLPYDGTGAQQARRSELQEIQAWDTRIYEERERSLTYICQQPVILEQRAFALAREIMNNLEP